MDTWPTPDNTAGKKDESDKEAVNKDFQGTRKVVQMIIDGRPIIRFGSGSTNETHADIVANALSEFGITDYQQEQTSEGYRPALKGERYEVVGGGLGTMLSNGKITLGGKSAGYGIGISKHQADKVGEESDTDFLIF